MPGRVCDRVYNVAFFVVAVAVVLTAVCTIAWPAFGLWCLIGQGETVCRVSGKLAMGMLCAGGVSLLAAAGVVLGPVFVG